MRVNRLKMFTNSPISSLRVANECVIMLLVCVEVCETATAVVLETISHKHPTKLANLAVSGNC